MTAPERAESIGWCVYGCGWSGPGVLQFTREVGTGAGPAYVDHAACERRPAGYRGHCVHCTTAILDSTPDVLQIEQGIAHQACEQAWERRKFGKYMDVR